MGDRCSSATLLKSESFDDSLIPAVKELVDGRVSEHVAGASLTTFAIGGSLRALVSVESVSELQLVLALLTGERQPTEILGFGSNVLIADGGLNSWVIRLGAQFRRVEELGSETYELGAAGSLMAIARQMSGRGSSGLEFAAGIPASLGGAVFMNAGAHGSELCERIVSVTGVLPDGTVHEWRSAEIPWRYRTSGLPRGTVVTSAKIKLIAGDGVAIQRACNENLAHRKKTQPLSQPSAGSVFKNPSDTVAAGRLLEEAGVKGLRIGGAMVSELHANWIVNPQKNATAFDVEALIRECADRVGKHSGVVLEPEVRVWRNASPRSNVD